MGADVLEVSPGQDDTFTPSLSKSALAFPSDDHNSLLMAPETSLLGSQVPTSPADQLPQHVVLFGQLCVKLVNAVTSTPAV